MKRCVVAIVLCFVSIANASMSLNSPSLAAERLGPDEILLTTDATEVNGKYQIKQNETITGYMTSIEGGSYYTYLYIMEDSHYSGTDAFIAKPVNLTGGNHSDVIDSSGWWETLKAHWDTELPPEQWMPAGLDFTFDITATGPIGATFTVATTELGNYEIVEKVLVFEIIPEPITLGLFGLGGLFLRRRK